MPGLAGLFQPQWSDLEDGKDKPPRRGYTRHTHGHPSIRARRSTLQFAAVASLFVVLLIYIRHYYETRATTLNGKITTLSDQITSLNHQLATLNDQLHFHELAVGEKRSTLKVTILTLETRDVSFWRESLGNKFKYARRHGYDFIPIFELPDLDGVAPVWAKLPLILQALDTKDPDWVLWMDFDTLFSNMAITVNDFLEDAKKDINKHRTGQKWEDVDMIAAGDCGDLNAGVMMFRNSPWTRSFLEGVWAARHTTNDGLNEQTAIENLLMNMGEIGSRNKHYVRVPQYKLNSYPEPICREDPNRPWKPGDWIIHFPGAWAYLTDSPDPFGEMVRKYYPLVME